MAGEARVRAAHLPSPPQSGRAGTPRPDDHGTCQAGGGITFRADFDSANLAHARQKPASSSDFELRTERDAANTEFATENRSWFYFGVHGHRAGAFLGFDVVDLNKQAKLFNMEMRPVVCCPAAGVRWQRVKSKPHFGPTGEGFHVAFRHRFETEDEHFFAFCFPHSYRDCQAFLDRMAAHAAASTSTIHFRREVLGRSRQGRNLEVLTVASDAADEGDPAKPVFFVSARVHPGEVPASHMFNGLLKFLLRGKDKRAEVARKSFVFKLVPMLNPDGVELGHYRCDSRGQNLNRFYADPSETDQPEIFAVKSLLKRYADQGRLKFYFDLHAHANKKGVFAFGNTLPPEEQVETTLYAKLMSLNCPHWDLLSCNFTEKNMSSKDRDGHTKEGSGRVALFRETGLPHIYTIESNYCTSRIMNIIPQAEMEREEGFNTRSVSPMSKSRSPLFFDTDIFEGMGRALVVSALDLLEVNPWTRVPNSPFKSMQALKTWANSFLTTNGVSVRAAGVSRISKLLPKDRKAPAHKSLAPKVLIPVVNPAAE